jgi:CMD domain protein
MSDNATDAIDMLAHLPPGSALAELRRQRPDVVRHTQGSDDAIFAPQDDGGFSRAERAAAALRVAIGLKDTVLAAHYRARLAALDPAGALVHATESASAPADRRWAAVRAHVDRTTADPYDAQRSDIDGLVAAGLSRHAVVSLSQVIAFVNFQSRVLAGLRMLESTS